MRLVVGVPVSCCAIVLAAVSCAPQTAPGAAAMQRDHAVWYEDSVTPDLDEDGEPDYVVLTARGHRPDSLEMELVFRVDGRAVYREAWNSAYELIDIDPEVRLRPRLDAFVRGRLETVLANLTVEPLDTATLKAISAERSVLEQITPRPTRQVTFSYGYESFLVLAWDPRQRRLVLLGGCC